MADLIPNLTEAVSEHGSALIDWLNAVSAVNNSTQYLRACRNSARVAPASITKEAVANAEAGLKQAEGWEKKAKARLADAHRMLQAVAGF